MPVMEQRQQMAVIVTFDPLNHSGLDFITELGRLLRNNLLDARELDFLFQRLSATNQRFNAVCFVNSFVTGRDTDHR